MEKSKKISICLVMGLVIVLSLCIIIFNIAKSAGESAYAQEIPSVEDKEETVTHKDSFDEGNDSDASPTLFSRIWEWCTVNSVEIFTVAGDIILVACFIFQKLKSKKKLLEIGSNIVTVKNDVANTANSQENVISVTNELIEGYNRFEKALNNFDSTEKGRYMTLLAAAAQTKAILDILTTVYANSKNIPQGVKDLVNLKYADVLKLVKDEKKLESIADTSEMGKAAETENIESTEGNYAKDHEREDN